MLQVKEPKMQYRFRATMLPSLHHEESTPTFEHVWKKEAAAYLQSQPILIKYYTNRCGAGAMPVAKTLATSVNDEVKTSGLNVEHRATPYFSSTGAN
ncbi:hypothetical protein EVAR_8613_1 [Eumeta japonica]|uniref:Uncharacterized protein n=1 Tax=Eumeta variegata TaxID=151549 RepID=A0A4C1XIF4_EUMVA|nr:hypothetical protein EVAR_8613_1 [Eumeta japonica]